MFKLNLVTKSMLAAGPNFNDFSNTLKELFNSMFTPLIAIASALAVIWGVYLGFKYWRSGARRQPHMNTYIVVYGCKNAQKPQYIEIK